MRRRRRFFAIALALFLVLLVAVLTAHGPLRRAIWASLHSPDRLPTSAADPRVKFESGAEELARAVAATLPEAVETIEKTQGRSFKWVSVYVFASTESFATYGAGTAGPRATTRGGRTFISPRIVEPPATVKKIVTHELSHAHLQQWMPAFKYVKTPSWFLEGLATFVSRGGGAEAVTDEEARAEIRRGHYFCPVSDTSLLFPRLVSVNGVQPRLAYPLAYRQASLFIAFLANENPAKLQHLVAILIDGQTFADAFSETFGRPIDQAWKQFLSQI